MPEVFDGAPTGLEGTSTLWSRCTSRVHAPPARIRALRPTQAVGELLRTGGAAVVEALDDLAAELAEKLDLGGRLRPFDDHIEIECIGDADDRLDQRQGLVIGSERRYEAPVHLQ